MQFNVIHEIRSERHGIQFHVITPLGDDHTIDGIESFDGDFDVAVEGFKEVVSTHLSEKYGLKIQPKEISLQFVHVGDDAIFFDTKSKEKELTE